MKRNITLKQLSNMPVQISKVHQSDKPMTIKEERKQADLELVHVKLYENG